MVINSLRIYRNKHKDDFGEVVICCDSDKYWRRDYFPYYKAGRVKVKNKNEKSVNDWKMIFQTMTVLKEELKTTFPYKVINVSGAEADDVIAILTKRYSSKENMLIVSSDKDFLQLKQLGKSVKQYSPIMSKFLEESNPKEFLMEHIIKGCQSDGVPNILSANDCLVSAVRQSPVSSKKLAEWVKMDPKDFCNDKMLTGFHRNNTLINFDMIPEEVSNSIMEEFDKYVPAKRSGLINYFMSKNLKFLMPHLAEF